MFFSARINNNIISLIYLICEKKFICLFIQQFFVPEGHTIITLPNCIGLVTIYLMTYLNKIMATDTPLEHNTTRKGLASFCLDSVTCGHHKSSNMR